MEEKEVVIVSTGVANVASVVAALTRVGAQPRLAKCDSDIYSAQYLVLPGVGSFESGMNSLIANGYVSPLRKRVSDRLPILAICLGMQLLFEISEESAGVDGLGIYTSAVRRLREAPRIPQLGWNLVEPCDTNSLFQRGYAYFANSYCVTDVPAMCKPAYAHYGKQFVAGFESDNILACQFHPELSGEWGHSLLKRWLSAGRGAPC